MTKKWISTTYKGVRYYEHPTRKHGKVMKDRYYAIRYQRGGKRVEEGTGWASELDPKDNKNWTAEKAALILADLKEASKGLKHGPSRLSERRDIEQRRKETEKADHELAEKEKITFKQYFNNTYYPTAKTHKKKQTYSKEEIHFRLWLDPVIGKIPLKHITPFDMERIKKRILDAGKAPRTAQYIMATARQIWNMARRDGIISGDSPTRSVKVPKFDNRRQRFLRHDEATLLLNKLKEKNEQVYQIAFLALQTGMRASEIFNLTWGCIDTERGIITILDAKSGHGRTAYMTEKIKTMFVDMTKGKNDDIVFPGKKGRARGEIPPLFRDAVKELKFNKDVSDTRQRVCFHSLRHSFGSWHAETGTDLYVIKELLGHGSITLTERYSHLTNGTLQSATRNLEQAIDRAGQEKDGQVVNFTK
jgi:site-specific recombinase XerD